MKRHLQSHGASESCKGSPGYGFGGSWRAGAGSIQIPQGFAKAEDLAVRVENPPAHPTEGAVVEIGEMILADIADEALAYPPGSLLVAELAALKEAQAETSRRREPARRGRGLAKYLYPTVRRRTD